MHLRFSIKITSGFWLLRERGGWEQSEKCMVAFPTQWLLGTDCGAPVHSGSTQLTTHVSVQWLELTV